MKLTRSHRSLIAWLLAGLVLFSGLACALGHGQMMGAVSRAPQSMSHGEHGHMAMAGHDHHGHMAGHEMPPGDLHAMVMKLAMTDCAFAGTLVLAVLALAALVLRPRAVRSRVVVQHWLSKKPPRLSLPALAPQAP